MTTRKRGKSRSSGRSNAAPRGNGQAAVNVIDDRRNEVLVVKTPRESA
jgi:hypothetical protein